MVSRRNFTVILTLTVSILLLSSCSSSINLPDTTGYARTIVQGDTVYQFSTLAADKKVKPRAERFYYYVMGNELNRAEGAYLGKVLDGPYQQFTRSKQLIQQGLFSSGVKDGTWQQWHANGHIAFIEKYNDGIPEGNWLAYDELGIYQWQRSYKNGLPDGEWINYYPNGNREKVVTYDEGILDGTFKEYNPDGKLYRQGKYKNGLIEGKVETYGTEGKAEITEYKAGQMAEPVTNTEQKKPSLLRRIFDFSKGEKEADTEARQKLEEKEAESSAKTNKWRWWPFKRQVDEPADEEGKKQERKEKKQENRKAKKDVKQKQTN